MKGWNKETIEEQLRLHKIQNKDDRYNYFEREFNCLWYCWELEKYTIKEIQRLNNIIAELERFLNYEIYCDFNKEMTKGYQDTLNKLKELKEGK